MSDVFARGVVLLLVLALAGCAIAPPRTDDPWEGFNRKSYAFNQKVDHYVVRPAAVGYRKVTTPGMREHINDFFTNLMLPSTIVNDLLQAQFKRAAKTTGRFLTNLTIGFLGFFDPASHFGIPEDNNSFATTLARWGVPEGPFLVLPLVGPTTLRDVWKLPVDGYLLDPLSFYSRHHGFEYGQQYLPQLLYLITLRSKALDVEDFLKSAYDPYVFRRDTYRQRRLYAIYYGRPPARAVERLQGLDEENFDPEKLMKQQREWEKKQAEKSAGSAGTVSAPP